MAWTGHLRADPLPWLLEDDTPTVRAAALQRLCGRPADDPEVAAARAAAMVSDPIRSILEAQHPEGWWVKSGGGYAPKYTSTVWQVIFLDQLGADPADERVRRACEYVLDHTRASSGGFAASGVEGDKGTGIPPPSRVIHCLNGNLVRALIGFGYLDDPRLREAVDWAARAITGDGMDRWYASATSGPGFACAANDGHPCAWGAVKELLGLARVPPRRRTALVRRAVAEGVEFLLSRDPAVADYPTAARETKPSGSWFRLGFPSAYVTDVLQNVEALAELGYAKDGRLAHALSWIEGLQTADGRWINRYAYTGKTTVPFEKQGKPSKWVTLRACTVLQAAYG